MSLFTRAPKLSLTALLAAAAALVAALISLAPAATAPADARPRVAGLTGLHSCGHLRGYLVKHRRAYGTSGVIPMPGIAGESRGHHPALPRNELV